MKKKVHFMGIGGSGMNAAAVLAKHEGFTVTGCDLDDDGDYLARVKKEGIKIFKGHSENHVKKGDTLVVSPAILFQNPHHPECKFVKKNGEILTWHKFIGENVLINKKVVGVTGTHGKSTTTAMAGKLLEIAGMDPSVLVGAKVHDWDGNLRLGKSDYFVIEADDFYEKFLDYKLNTVILNNIEFDHPDFFDSEKEMLSSYEKLLRIIPHDGLLIYNKDSDLASNLVDKIADKKYKSIGYSLGAGGDYQIVLRNLGREENTFALVDNSTGKAHEYKTTLPGLYNIYNLAGVIVLGYKMGIRTQIIKKFTSNFSGIGRRLELIGKKHGVTIYDDYAHHPTAIKETLCGLREKYKNERILAVIEPHTYSRTKALLNLYQGVFENVDEVIITKIYKSRDKKTYGVDEESIKKASGFAKTKVIKNFEDVVTYVSENNKKIDVVVVMGAGDSYKLSRMILNSL